MNCTYYSSFMNYMYKSFNFVYIYPCVVVAYFYVADKYKFQVVFHVTKHPSPSGNWTLNCSLFYVHLPRDFLKMFTDTFYCQFSYFSYTHHFFLFVKNLFFWWAIFFVFQYFTIFAAVQIRTLVCENQQLLLVCEFAHWCAKKNAVVLLF